MRSFDKIEKKIIRKLVNISNPEERGFENFIFDDTDSSYYAIEWNQDNTEVEVFYHPDKSIPDKFISWDLICEKIFLFKYLEDNDLIGTYRYGIEDKERVVYNKNKYSRIEESGGYKKKNGKMCINQKSLFYSDMGRLLDRYASSAIYVSQALKNLVAENFINKQEKQYKTTVKISIIAILTSFLIGILGCIF